MNYISCYLLLTTIFILDKVSMLNRNAYDLCLVNRNKRSVHKYGKKI